MGANKKELLKDFARELEAQQVARKNVDLTLNCVEMWEILKEVRLRIKLVPETSPQDNQSHFFVIRKKIEELETNMPCIFLESLGEEPDYAHGGTGDSDWKPKNEKDCNCNKKEEAIIPTEFFDK